MAYAETLLALADPTRRAVFETIAQMPRSVGDLAETLPVSRPAVSQHLKVLMAANLVSATAQGTRRIYAVNPTGLAALRDYLDQFWGDTLGAYAAEVARQTQT